MKIFNVIATIALIVLCILLCGYSGSDEIAPETNYDDNKKEIEDKRIDVAANITSETILDERPIMIEYTSMEVPNIDSSFKTWMSYKAVTSVSSQQYKYINEYGWVDENGFMRSCADDGVEQDYYLIALGSYYGTEIGAKYRITLDTGNVFYGVLADCKDDRHTEETNRYIVENGNVVEFLVDVSTLNKTVKVTGSANYYEPLKGKVAKIEIINFFEI